MSLGRDPGIFFSLCLDAHDQVGLARRALGHEKGIDPPGLRDQRHVGLDSFGNRLEEGEVGRAGEMPVLGIPHHEIENVLVRGKHYHGRMADPGLNLDDAVFGMGQPQDGRFLRGDVARRDAAICHEFHLSAACQQEREAVMPP